MGFLELAFMDTLFHIHVTFSSNITRGNNIINQLVTIILDGNNACLDILVESPLLIKQSPTHVERVKVSLIDISSQERIFKERGISEMLLTLLCYLQ